MSLTTSPRSVPKWPSQRVSRLASAVEDADIPAISKQVEEGQRLNVVWRQDEMETVRATGGCCVTGVAGESSQSWANSSTPLHLALSYNHRDVAAYLIHSGCDINILNILGRSALHEAAKESDYEHASFLLQLGADVMNETEARSFKDLDGIVRSGAAGLTPLHEAIGVGDVKMLKLLLDQGAHVNHVTSDGWTPLDLALLDQQPTVAEVLLDRGGRLSISTPFDIREQNHTTEREQQRHIAHLLLEHDSIIPLPDCHETYLRLIFRADLISLSESTNDSKLRSTRLVRMISSILRQAAEIPDLSAHTERHCLRCQDFQQRPFHDRKEAFALHHDREMLVQSAESGCQLCRVLAEVLEKGDRINKVHDSRVMLRIQIDSFEAMANPKLSLSCGDAAASLDIFFLEDAVVDFLPLIEGESTARDSEDFRAKPVTRWLQLCNTQHEECRSWSTTPSTLPTRVIDVGGDHPPFLYISKDEQAQYCALSYCWGPSTPFRTMKANVESCTSEIPLESLPRTLHDAIIITRKLGFRYLWIDAICIIQDNEEDWHREAANMGDIFANATLTLSASDAADCTQGIFRSGRYRCNTPVPIALEIPRYYKKRERDSCNSLCVLPHQANDTSNDYWSRKPGPIDLRAWTLQEQLLAPRILHFSEGAMFWQCLCLSASESDPTALSHLYRSVGSKDRELREIKLVTAKCKHGAEETTAKEAYETWANIVSMYTPRAITRPADRVTALLGVSERIGSALGDSSIAGVWKGHYFWQSLLWVAAKQSHPANPQQFDLPSWSWASVAGPTKYHTTLTSELTWEIQDYDFDVEANQSQTEVTGVIRMKGTMKVFHDLDFGRCRNPLRNPLTSHLQEHDLQTKSVEKLVEELCVVEGFKDRISEDVADVWCIVIARIAKQPPPKWGYPAFLGGRPASIICLCLTPTNKDRSSFRRVGLCEFWDTLSFWEGAMPNYELSIA